VFQSPFLFPQLSQTLVPSPSNPPPLGRNPGEASNFSLSRLRFRCFFPPPHFSQGFSDCYPRPGAELPSTSLTRTFLLYSSYPLRFFESTSVSGWRPVHSSSAPEEGFYSFGFWIVCRRNSLSLLPSFLFENRWGCNLIPSQSCWTARSTPFPRPSASVPQGELLPL